jgi:hypothetical protein
MHPIMQYLEDNNSEQDLLEELLKQVNANMPDDARSTAARIKAIRDIRFTLLKLVKENERTNG